MPVVFFTHLSDRGALEGLCAVLPAPLAAPSGVSISESCSTAAVQGERAGPITPDANSGHVAEVEVWRGQIAP